MKKFFWRCRCVTCDLRASWIEDTSCITVEGLHVDRFVLSEQGVLGCQEHGTLCTEMVTGVPIPPGVRIDPEAEIYFGAEPLPAEADVLRRGADLSRLTPEMLRRGAELARTRGGSDPT